MQAGGVLTFLPRRWCLPEPSFWLHITVPTPFKGPQVTNDENFTAFSSKFIVQPYATTRITYLYTLPNRVYENGIGSHYDLYVVKQGGIDRYILNTSVKLPAGAKLIHAENVGSNLTFTDDAHVSVVYT